MNVLGPYFLGALALSLLLTPACRSIAYRFGFVATPRADRWGRRPAALFGGVGIFCTVVALGAASGAVQHLWPLLLAGTLIAGVGLLDDVFSLKPSTKLIAQISVASLLLYFGYRLHWTESAIGDAMLTLFWIVGITNAFNLLDNMDGLCSGIALIAGVCLLGSTPHGVGPAEVYIAILLGACAGFLVFNIHPASIFLGDTGSLFLGVNLATLTLVQAPQGVARSGLLYAVAVPVLLLLIPIFDTTFVTAVRLLSGRKPSHGGRDHTSHRLVAIGLSEPRAVTTLWGLAAGGGVISLLIQKSDPRSWPIVAALTFVVAMVIFAVYLARIRTYANDGDLAVLYNGTITPLVTNFMYKRRVAEVLLDFFLIPLAYYSAYRLRFEGRLFAAAYPQFIESLPVVLAGQILALFVVGAYRGSWRYFGMMDAVVTAKGIVAGTIGLGLVFLYLFQFETSSKAVLIIYAAILLILHTGSRASFRLISEFVRRRRDTGQRLLIYGAGEAGAIAVRELMGERQYRMLGFIDDDESKGGSRVQGYPVLTTYRGLVPLVEKGAVDRIVISTHSVPASRVHELEQLCAARGIGLSRLNVQLDHLVTVAKCAVSIDGHAGDAAVPAAAMFIDAYGPRGATGREVPE